MVAKVGTRASIGKHMTRKVETIALEWASDAQRDFFCYGPSPVVASGGFGSSKTYGACLKVLTLCDLYPGNRGIIARKIWDDLRKTTMQTFFKLCPLQAYDRGRRSDAEKILVLNNGSQILWAHLDDPDIEGVIKGVEINFCLIDQAEQVSEEVFDMLQARLGRWDQAQVPETTLAMYGGLEKWPWKSPAGKPIPPIHMMLTCNPDSELHWIYRRFHEDSEEWRERWSKLHYQMFTMRSEDNKFLPKQNLDEMLTKDKAFVDRYVHGKWGIPEGQIHTIDPLSVIPGTNELLEWLTQTCTLHRVLDHGDAAPTACGWFAVDRAGNVFFYREYYRPNAMISEHRQMIRRMSRWEKYQFNLADPSIFFKTAQKHGGMWSVADEYGDVTNLPRDTAVFWQPADNNELGTRNRINEYLRVDPDRVHPITHEKGSPRLFFLEANQDYPEGCRHIIKETRAQRRKQISTENGKPIFCDERDEGVVDHGYDCLRYAVSSRPPVATTIEPGVPARCFQALRQQAIRFKRRGGYRMLARQQARRAEMRT